MQSFSGEGHDICSVKVFFVEIEHFLTARCRCRGTFLCMLPAVEREMHFFFPVNHRTVAAAAQGFS